MIFLSYTRFISLLHTSAHAITKGHLPIGIAVCTRTLQRPFLDRAWIFVLMVLLDKEEREGSGGGTRGHDSSMLTYRSPESPVGDEVSLESDPLAAFDRWWVEW
jgi:hypothetical protein